MNTEVLSEAIVFYLILVISIGFHEWGHAFVADKLGDMTPRSQGRVTLNPIAHMDLIGTVILPMLMLLPAVFGAPLGFMFGWGKPVMVDSRSFKKPKRDDLLVTGAGPLGNLLLALITAIIGGFVLKFIGDTQSAIKFKELLDMIIMINAMLAVFNMIPIPPLDGSHFLKYAVNMSDETYMKLSQWGLLILIILINTPLFTIFQYAAYYLSLPFRYILISIV